MRRRPVAQGLGIAFCSTIIPVLVAFGVFLWSSTVGEQERIRDQVRTIAADVRSNVDRELDGLVGTLQALATSPALKLGDLEAFYQQALDVVAVRGSAIAVRRPDGQQLLNTYVPWGAPLPVSTDPILRAADRAAIESRRPVVSDLYLGAVANKPFILVVVPVQIENEVRYLLNIAVDPQRLATLLASKAHVNGLFAIVDGNFKVVARSRAHDRFVNQPATPDIAINVAANADWWNSRTLDGVDSVVAYAPSQLGGWKYLASVPAQELVRPLRSSVAALAFGALGSILIAALVAASFGRRLTRAINSLVATAETPDRPAPKSGFGEIDDVSLALTEKSHQLVLTLRRLQEAAEHRELLIHEVAHRAQNMLATMQSVARFSLSERDPAATRAFLHRLQIMGKVNSALLTAELKGLPIADVFEIGLDQFVDRVRLDGPPIVAVPKTVLTLSLVANELAEVSGLKSPSQGAPGAVLTWQISEDTFHCTWDCTVECKSSSWADGFATFLLQKVVAIEFEADAQCERKANHFRYTFTCPIRIITRSENGTKPDA